MKLYKHYWLAGVAVAATMTACSSTNMGITSKVKAKLAADPVVQAHQIDVDTSAGVVTLTGNIDSQEAKDRALTLARETEGVKQVRDMIAVRTETAEGDSPSSDRPVGQVIDDGMITMKVKARLGDDPMVKARNIDVDTKSGVVYLTGEVASDAERDQAVRIARDTEGVTDVQANLRIGVS